jgi:hypothetical protein
VKVNWDFFGIITSLTCAVHCALLPVVVSSLPMFGINIIHNRPFEWGMILLAFLVGCYSIMHGYFRHHKNPVPFYIFFSGIFFLVLKQLFPVYEYFFLGMAVLLIIIGHFINYRYCQRIMGCDSPHHKH